MKRFEAIFLGSILSLIAVTLYFLPAGAQVAKVGPVPLEDLAHHRFISRQRVVIGVVDELLGPYFQHTIQISRRVGTVVERRA